MEGLKGEERIAAICRREGIAPSLYYKWSKAFLEAGKQRLKGDTIREANSDQVSELRKENEQIKQLVAELSLKNRVLKKKFEWTGVKLRRYMRYSQPEKMQIIRLVEESRVSVKQTLAELNINRVRLQMVPQVSAGRLRCFSQPLSAAKTVLEPDPAMVAAAGG